ncbi:uncharacterized protein BP01DRAFT_390189 [Aspergillus saccharolyticus JOP 1030-1]|uniref:Uncharacterized protein n=1 Tax=Aspergillus saccharolyticus JOP 1030-1 TaxID=1450539 RepID=A0A319A4H8_9EURO|nr:hypothetical protein BP01DRAFT_390189 [Aspergillus saccharolyticus JOP 1030-1]PYH47048.1 hypothetical protein BP01DRAFT_390189 [Aspergillus saccharolyticus JOP 1030-1]
MEPFTDKRAKLAALQNHQQEYLTLLDELRQDEAWYKALRCVVERNLTVSQLVRICTLPVEQLSPDKRILNPAVLYKVVPRRFLGRAVEPDLAGWAVLEATGLAIAAWVCRIKGVYGMDQEVLKDGRRCWRLLLHPGYKVKQEQLPGFLREADWFRIPGELVVKLKLKTGYNGEVGSSGESGSASEQSSDTFSISSDGDEDSEADSDQSSEACSGLEVVEIDGEVNADSNQKSETSPASRDEYECRYEYHDDPDADPDYQTKKKVVTLSISPRSLRKRRVG